MPAASTFPPLDIPNKDIYSFVFERDGNPFPDNQVIFIDGNTKRQLTWADVRAQAEAFGVGLQSQWGWRQGDVLAIFSTNQIDLGGITWGTMWAGGVVTTANPVYGVDELTFQLRDSRARGLVTLAELLPVATQAAANAGIPKDRVIVIGDSKSNYHKHWTEIIDSGMDVSWSRVRIEAPEKELAFLVYSSGTTGLPKGVMLSHKNIVANLLQYTPREELGWTSDRLISFLPLFHIYGLTCILHNAMITGLPTVVMDRFELHKFCQHVQNYRITFAYAVPPVILLLAKHPDVAKYDLSSIKMINSGAAPLTRELVESLYARLRIPVKQGYGLTETSPVTHVQPWSSWRSHIGSVGLLMPNMTTKFVSKDGAEAPVGEIGEIWVSGPNIMMGYLNNPTATANAITSDGFFKTGDVGYQDKDGNLYITDRLKELIKYKGFQVAPAELEGLLLGHEKVSDCAVTGVYSEELATEVPRAFVVLGAGVQGTKEIEEELIRYVEGKAASYKWLRGGVRFLDIVPKSAAGKILRRVLRDMAKKEDEEKRAVLKAKI